MSNIKQVDIKGLAPYDFRDWDSDEENEAEDYNEALKILGMFNLPTMGLRIDYMGLTTYVEAGPSDGTIAYYAFEISGREAVSLKFLELIASSFQRCSVRFSRFLYRDIENNYTWRGLTILRDDLHHHLIVNPLVKA